jgi:hypothetical protein
MYWVGYPQFKSLEIGIELVSKSPVEAPQDGEERSNV